MVLSSLWKFVELYVPREGSLGQVLGHLLWFGDGKFVPVFLSGSILASFQFVYIAGLSRDDEFLPAILAFAVCFASI
jgi:hypothetical protein